MIQKHSGNQHVEHVKQYLLDLMNGIQVDVTSSAATTALYLYQKHPDVESVRSKFDFKNPDQHPDLILQLHSQKIPYHLFKLKTGDIQPRNLGGKSFLAKYFSEPYLQEKFNARLESLYVAFFNRFLHQTDEYQTLTHYRKEIRRRDIRFSSYKEARKARNDFLFSLREYTLEIFQEILNHKEKEVVIYGLNSLLFNGETMIVSIEKAPTFLVYEKSYQFSSSASLILFRRGNDSIGFTDGKITFYIRFKFESQPDSPIKLITALSTNHSIPDFNHNLIDKFEAYWNQLVHSTDYVTSNDPNSVGKVNEALIYHFLLQNQPNIIPDEISAESRHIKNLKTYGRNLKQDTLQKLRTASKTAVERILLPVIKESYVEYSVAALSLTDDAYRLDIKDNSDIKVTLTPLNPNISNDLYKELRYSLKANAKSNSLPVVKNPGFGTILGVDYFKIGETDQIAKKLKDLFTEGKLTRDEVLESANQYLATFLSEAPVDSLKRGISTIIGEIPTLHTFYEENNATLSEVTTYGDDITFIPNYPTKINNALLWNNQKERLIMRVKFSAGESHGWSSLKLACTYKIIR